MGERPSEYLRDEHDWYVEPAWAVQALTDAIPTMHDVHDPCCGMGTICRTMYATGADLIDRGYGYPVRNFLDDENLYTNIVTNPPYKRAQEIIEHAIAVTTRRVAALVQIKFLTSQRRHALFNKTFFERVIILSRRPSMPPGKMLELHGEGIRGNGSMDFCWVVWNHAHRGPASVEFAM